MPTPRIPPLAATERDAATEELLAGVRTPDGDDLNLFATLARHPSLFRKWLPFGGALLYRGVLSARHREILILRTAWRCGAEYEWVHHAEVGEREGMTPEEIAVTSRADIDERSGSAIEQALMRAVDDLHDRSVVSDDVWGVLAGELDERALIEVCMLVGHYHMVAFALNSLGVELEAGAGTLDMPGQPRNSLTR